MTCKDKGIRKLKFVTIFHKGEEGQSQHFFVRATFSLFSGPSHHKIPVLSMFFFKCPTIGDKILFLTPYEKFEVSGSNEKMLIIFTISSVSNTHSLPFSSYLWKQKLYLKYFFHKFLPYLSVYLKSVSINLIFWHIYSEFYLFSEYQA